MTYPTYSIRFGTMGRGSETAFKTDNRRLSTRRRSGALSGLRMSGVYSFVMR